MRVYNSTDIDLPEVARQVLSIFTASSVDNPRPSRIEQIRRASIEFKRTVAIRKAHEMQLRLGIDVAEPQRKIDYAI